VGALIEIRREGRGVAEVLGSEQMSRSGDGDAAGNLRRVTGLTLVGGKYVYVRGLGERYSSILLNDAALSSPEPSRRVVPLDLFPTSVLETLIIEKAYTSDLPGEFGGGAIRIGTKPIPNQFFARMQVGANTSGAATSVLSYQGGATDHLGIDDGARALPANVREATADGRRLKEVNPLFPQGFTPEQLQDFGRSFSRVWSTREVAEDPQPSMNAAIGQVWKLGDAAKMGGQISMLYGRDLEAVEKESSKYSLGVGGKLVRDVLSRRLESESEVRWAATGDWGLQWDQTSVSGAISQHRLSMTNIWLKHTSNQASLGDETNANGRFRSTSLSWVERELLIQQARGEHEWNSAAGFQTRIRYRGSRAQAGREAPDQRDSRYQWENEQFVFSTRADGNQRSFSELRDETLEWGGDLKLSQKTTWGAWASTWGATEVRRDRESKLRRFHFRDVRPTGSTLNLAQPLENVLSVDNISPNGFQILETTRETDNYQAGQEISALSTTVDLEIQKRWRLSAGARHEVSTQDVLTYNLFDPENKPVRAGLETRDVLPSMTGTWEMIEGHQLRAAYAETISRPDFKELSMAPYIDEETGQEVKGNARLRNSVIRHYDLRYEFYPSTEESFSFAIFRKDFDRPIEQVMRAQGDETVRTYDNARRAENDGIELESRWRLRRWSETLRRFTVAGNLAIIRSQIEIEPSAATVQTSNQRPLQGQSPWVVNLQLYYDHKTYGLASGLLFNVVGPRIREASTGGLPDIYEQAQPQLDYVMSWKFHQPESSSTRRFDPAMQIQLRAKNLLDTETRLTQGDQVTLAYRRGRSFGLQLSAVF
jgi:outer membrane receptor protein involved in Fe transport